MGVAGVIPGRRSHDRTSPAASASTFPVTTGHGRTTGSKRSSHRLPLGRCTYTSMPTTKFDLQMLHRSFTTFTCWMAFGVSTSESTLTAPTRWRSTSRLDLLVPSYDDEPDTSMVTKIQTRSNLVRHVHVRLSGNLSTSDVFVRQ